MGYNYASKSRGDLRQAPRHGTTGKDPAMRDQSIPFIEQTTVRRLILRAGDPIPLGVNVSAWRGRICQACGVWFMRRDNRGDYCSTDCYHRPGVRTKRNRTGTRFTCESCGKSFYRHLADIRKGTERGSRMRFCSKTCEANTKRRGEIEQRTCEGCGATFAIQPGALRWATKQGRVAGRFCSAKCRDRVSHDERRTAVMIPCFTCGKPVRRVPALLKRRTYCDPQCMGADRERKIPRGWGRGGVRPDIGFFVRSRWEANVCRVLRAMGLDYEYESRTFRLDGCSYRPDFWVSAWNCWIEVKGYMLPNAAAKITTFRALYPDERLIVLDQPIYQAMEREWSPRIPEWEFLRSR